MQVFLARESLGSTAIGNGIALPHVRNPVVMHVPQPMVTLCFLEHPVEFDAMDGQPVHTLFTMLSPTVRAHLQMLARLSFALRQTEFAEAISRRGSREEILQACEAVDRSISGSRLCRLESPRHVVVRCWADCALRRGGLVVAHVQSAPRWLRRLGSGTAIAGQPLGAVTALLRSCVPGRPWG